ncbi:ABC transporter ATP-binding protein [Citricoccus muralis]|uniref:ATP-binding cassette domain-containing protein n=1 Tax=Citricoccus muralis TaxID=169134 RepID=A0ABY8H8R8_9MICC|nr:ATP-binding cassette domain-containing protein [Citricoccus muralis]WFP17053.1 ATP-binding cassette domain-containing protein [Citricoccus muralis]
MISLRSIHKSFGDHHVLKNITFDIKPGLMTGFVGGNGAGKTTTMRTILGVLTPDSGSIEVNGAPITADYRAAIGYMPEERGLYPKMKVLEQLVYLAQLHGMPAAEAKRRGADLLERLNLDLRANDKLEELSLGNQQRAQIAAALIHDPVALVLDEPFSGLDPLAVETTVEVLRDTADAGAPVLFSSHQLDLVERLCDELVIVAAGEVRAAGTREEILRASATPEWEIRSAADAGWIRETGVDVLEFDGGWARFSADSLEHANQVLAQAQQRGTVEYFGTVNHTLHDIFKETIR